MPQCEMAGKEDMAKSISIRMPNELFNYLRWRVAQTTADRGKLQSINSLVVETLNNAALADLQSLPRKES
jgi:hypothetical protein